MNHSFNSNKTNSNNKHIKSSTFFEYNTKIPSNNNKMNFYYKNLILFSKKILEAKYSCTPELYERIILNNLILKKRSHNLAKLNELAITTNLLKEQLKRYYIYEESKKRVPKYVSYYHNYLKFFCKPIFSDYLMNKKMVKHMEKVAQIFYNENYADEDELKESKNPKCNFKIFSKSVNHEIDNYANFTKVENDSFNSKFLQFRNNDLDLLEKIYKITPILDLNKLKKNGGENKNNLSYEEGTKNTEMNSYQKILNEINYKKKGKNKENIFKKSPLFAHNSSVFDYFNGLSIMLFGKKKRGLLNKNNSLNNKFKKKDKSAYNNNKIINNININIKHLTIGQKSINTLSEINKIYNNCFNKKSKKSISKSRKYNSMILRDKSFKKYITHFGNHTSKNLEYKKRNDSFNIFHPPKAIIEYNSNNYKKISTINTNSILTNTRNKSKLKNAIGKINNGCVTSMNKNKKNNQIKNQNQTGKMTIYTNSINTSNHNYIKNMLNIMNSSNSKTLKDLNNKSTKNININHNIRNNMSSLSLYKNSLAVMSPLLFTKKYKNSNISLNKGITPMSNDRIKTTSHKSSYQNLSNINYNYNNFKSPKNIKTNYYKERKNAKSHANLRSPMNIENQGKKYNSILYKKSSKGDYNDTKVLNLKYKNYIKFNGLKKNMKDINKKYKSYNKGKKGINNKIK